MAPFQTRILLQMSEEFQLPQFHNASDSGGGWSSSLINQKLIPI